MASLKLKMTLSLFAIHFWVSTCFAQTITKDSIAALLADPKIRVEGTLVAVSGFYRAADGGGGTFIWRSALAGHNGGTLISPAVTYAPGASGWWNPATNVGVWQRAYDQKTVNLNWFGVMADGVTDYTLALLRITNWAGKNKQGLSLAKGVLRARFIRLYNGTTKFTIGGTIKGIGTPDVNGLIQIDGPSFGGTEVSNILVSANIDMSNGDIKAIHASRCLNCQFVGNNIFGFVSSPMDVAGDSSKYKYGILLNGGSSGNTVARNKITGSFNPNARQMLIDVLSTYAPGVEYGGYFTGKGQITMPVAPALNNVISDNVLTNGSYGVLIIGGDYNKILSNRISGSNHRGIAMYSTWHTLVSANMVTDYKSSGILMAYMSNYNVVRGNTFKDVLNPYGASDEASVNINLGSSMNVIDANIISSERTYGVYMAIGMFQNSVTNNTIQSFNRVGIAIENDWEANPPALAKYSRSNYSPPTSVSTSNTWAFNDSQLNVIQGNTIGAAKPFRTTGATCAIYMSAINPSGVITTRNWRNLIQDNIILDSKLTHYLYIYEEAPGGSFSHRVINNKFPTADKSKIFISGNNVSEMR